MAGCSPNGPTAAKCGRLTFSSMNLSSPRVALAVLLGLSLSGCAVHPPPPTADQLRADKQHRLAPLTPQVEEARAKLLAEYRELITSLCPSYNGITVEFQGNVYGNEYGFFFASHPLFSRDEFSAGPIGPTIYQWIQSHKADFRRAQVTLVGLRVGSGEMGPTYDTGADSPNSPNYVPG